MTRVIEPEKGRVLVKLGVSKYGNVPVPEKTYDTVNEGEIIAVNEIDRESWGYLVGRTGHFKDYMDDLRVATLPTGKKLALIRIDNIEGTSYDDKSN
jgi:hypothetical protein